MSSLEAIELLMTYVHRFDFSLTGAFPWVPLSTLECPSSSARKCPYLITYFDIFVSCLLSSFFLLYTPIDRWTLFCLASYMKIIIRDHSISSSSDTICLFLNKAIILIHIVLSSHVQTCCVLNIQLTFTNTLAGFYDVISIWAATLVNQ